MPDCELLKLEYKLQTIRDQATRIMNNSKVDYTTRLKCQKILSITKEIWDVEVSLYWQNKEAVLADHA